MFSSEFFEIFKIVYFVEHLQTAPPPEVLNLAWIVFL